MNERLIGRSAPMAFTLFAMALGVFPAPPRLFGESPPRDKPNILFIVVDDLKPLLGCYGDSEVRTPNIDALAARGMLFENNHCQQAVCAPSRASLLTGKYPDTVKVWDLKTQIRDVAPGIVTLPQHLKAHGYTTAGLGKVFDGRSVDAAHDAPSWSIAHWTPDSRTEYQYADPRHFANFRRLDESGALTGDPRGVLKKHGLLPPVESVDLPDSTYPDGKIADRGIALIEQLADSKSPFFLALGFYRPHLPFAAPKRYWDLYKRGEISLQPFQKMPEGSPAFAFQNSWELRSVYSGIAEGTPLPPDRQKELIHGYHACVSFIDAQIGRILSALETNGLRENTIVVLWGDHGWHLGDHGMWCKHTNYEQATRSPLILAGPGIPGRQRTLSPTEFTDVHPTLCELAGIPAPGDIEGASLVPLFQDSGGEIRFAAQSQFPRKDGATNLMGYTYRSSRYRYTEWRNRDSGDIVAREFFDYEADPMETVNAIDKPEYREIIGRFEAEAKRSRR